MTRPEKIYLDDSSSSASSVVAGANAPITATNSTSVETPVVQTPFTPRTLEELENELKTNKNKLDVIKEDGGLEEK